MPMKTVKGWVRDARYFAEEKSLVLVIEDLESKKQLKPIQVSVNAFMKGASLSVAADDGEAWRFFAKQLMRRSSPLTVEFEDSNEEGSKG